MKYKPKKKCNYPDCTSQEAWRLDIETSWFRGDDVVLDACKEHRKHKYHADLLKTEKALKQMA